MGEATLTIKYGKGYEASWIVFRGETAAIIRQQVVDYFGINEAEVSKLSLHELALNVTKVAQGTSNMSTILGATAIGSADGSLYTGPPHPADSQPATPPAASTPAEEPVDPLLGLKTAIEAANSVPELQRVWAENQAAFNEHAVLMDLYKAKGKALQTAA